MEIARIMKRLSVIIFVAIFMLGSTFVIDAETASIVVPVRYEQGRYTVANGGAVASTINIRSTDFLQLRGSIQLSIPSQYSVTVHQYRGNNVRTYIDCLAGLSGMTSVDLNQETNYIRLSIKKRNNSVIQPYEGDSIKLYRYVADSDPDPIDSGGWEQGRYAVGTGKPIASDVNIRSRDYITATNNTLSLQIPSGYTVSVHEYSSHADSSFIKSRSGLRGNISVALSNTTQYVKFSFKRTNNSVISPADGDKLQYTFVNTPDSGTNKAMLTIIDDDGDIKYYTDIYPLAKAKNVSISTAVPASFIGKTNYLTWEMISEIRGSGIEVLCHTYGHPLSTKIDGMTENDFRSDYSRAKEIFNAHGINADLLVFSGSTGLYSKAQIPAQELFKGAFLAGDNKTNQVGTNPYNIKRYRIGSNYAWNVQALEGLIDSLKETGGWMVWMMHTSDKANYTSNVPSVLGEVIDYCKEQGISIVTAEYGFSQYCN